LEKEKKIHSKSYIKEERSAFDERYDELFDATDSQNLKLIRHVHDSKLLNLRYLSNLTRKYTTLVDTADDRKIEGYIVLRIRKYLGNLSDLLSI
jgi:hypothetical protein